MLTLVLVAAFAITWVLGDRARFGPRPLHSATFPGAFRNAPGHPPIGAQTSTMRSWVTMARRRDPIDRPPSRPIRNPFASSDPLAKHRAITGINVHVRWYERLGSLLGIAVLVVIMGVLVAVCIGAAFFAARIVLELLVG